MLRRSRQFLRNRRGLAAVEFALIAPVMIVMFCGTVELSNAVDCNARVSQVSSTVADLVAQSTTVSTAGTTNIFAAANAILFPNSITHAKIVVSSLVDDGNGHVSVAWSDALNTSPRTAPPANIPDGLIATGGSVIYAEVVYTYNSVAGDLFGASFNLKSDFYAKPRRSVTVKHT